MSNSVTFGSLAVNAPFIYNGVNYVKTETVRISCCKSVNAVNAQTSERVYMADDTTVQVV
jgi:hypothetical protein